MLFLKPKIHLLHASCFMLFVACFTFFGFAQRAHAAITLRPMLNTGLVGYWSMDEGSGDKTYDLSGTGNVGTLTQMDPATDWADGKIGKALDFDGSDDHVDAGDQATLDMGLSDMTISAWINPSSSGGFDDQIVNKRSGAFSAGYDFRYDHAGQVVSGRVCSAGTGASSAASSVPRDAWTHVAVSFDRDGNMTMYVNGAVSGTPVDISGCSGETQSNSDPFSIGCRVAGGVCDAKTFLGKIDEARVYNRVLMAEEIRRLYLATRPNIVAPNDTDLVGYWSMEEGAGTKAGDSSGNGNDGTINSVVATDNFDRANANPISGNWTTGGYTGMYHQIASNGLKGSQAGSGQGYYAYYNVGTFSNAQYAQATIVNRSLVLGVSVRGSSSGAYYFLFDGTASYFGRSNGDASYFNDIGGNRGSFSDGDTIGLSVDDNYHFTFYKNGQVIGTERAEGSNAVLPSGSPGLSGYNVNTSGTLDNWEGGNVIWVDGKRGKALNFDGTSNYVNTSTESNFDFLTDSGQPFSASFWVKGEANAGRMITKMNSVVTGGFQIVYGDNFYDTELQNISVNISDGTNEIGRYTSDQSVPFNTWKQVVVVYNGSGYSSSNLHIYLNGSEASYAESINNGTLATQNNSEPLRIGKRSSGNYFDGQLDEVRIYNRALSSTEIANLYQSSSRVMNVNSSQNNRLTSGLVGLWSFDGPDISGANAYDRSGNSNTGAITGATPALGQVGQALNFDGSSNQNVNVGSNNFACVSGSPMTISAWIYPRSSGENSGGRIFSRIAANSNYDCTLQLSGDQFQFAWSGTTSLFRRTSVATVTLNSWQHILVTWDGSLTASNIHIYRDGAELSYATTTNGSGLYDTSNQASFIGKKAADDRDFDGKIDEVRVYNRVLSAAEVQELYNMGK